MSKKSKFFLFFAFILNCILSSCFSFWSYRTWVNAYSDMDDTQYQQLILSSKTFAVIEDEKIDSYKIKSKKVENQLLNREIKRKIEKLLRAKNYRLTNLESADYYFFYTYKIGAPRTKTQTTIETRMAKDKSTHYIPKTSSYVVYDKSLKLQIADGEYFRKTGKVKVLWFGDVSDVGQEDDFRSIVNYLLVSGFHLFGKNTEAEKPVDLKKDDDLLRVLSQK